MPLDDTSINPAQHTTIRRCVSLGVRTTLRAPGGVDLQVHPRVSLDPAINCGTQELRLEVGESTVLKAQVRERSLQAILTGPVVPGQLPNPLLEGGVLGGDALDHL